jgi:AcrR family transcriptional regulator
MTGDSQVQDRIIEKAEELFLKFGVSKVTVDEISSELGMSKKTLYKYFESKEALISAVMSTRRDRIKGGVYDIIQSDRDLIEKLSTLMTFLGAQFSQATPNFLHDLRRTAPHVCGEMENDRSQHAMDAFKVLGQEGIAQGYFRDDINLEFLAVMHVAMMQGVMMSDIVARLPLTAAQVFQSMLDVMFFGMFTEKGREKMCALRNKKHN